MKLLTASRFLLASLTMSLFACSSDPTSIADADPDATQDVDDNGAKTDGVTRPRGTFTLTNAGSAPAGTMAKLVLMAQDDDPSTRAFHAETLVQCVTAPCDPTADDGSYKFTKSGSTRYVVLQNGTTSNKFAYQLATTEGKTTLQLRKVYTKTWLSYELSASAWCAEASQCELQGLANAECANASWTCDDSVCASSCAPAVYAEDEFLAAVQSAAQVDGEVLTYMSESDYPVLATSLGDKPAAITGEAIFASFEDVLLDGIFEEVSEYADELTFRAYSGDEAVTRINGFADADRFEPGREAELAAWQQLVSIATTRLDTVHLIKIGPKADDGSLAKDHGLYAYAFVGISKDGKLVAIYFGAVET